MTPRQTRLRAPIRPLTTAILLLAGSAGGLTLASCAGTPTTGGPATDRGAARESGGVNAGLASLTGDRDAARGPDSRRGMGLDPADPLLDDVVGAALGELDAGGAPAGGDQDAWARSAAMLEQYFDNLRDPWGEEPGATRVASAGERGTQPTGEPGEPAPVAMTRPTAQITPMPAQPAPQPVRQEVSEPATLPEQPVEPAPEPSPESAFERPGLVAADAEPTAPARVRTPEERKADLVADLGDVLRELAGAQDGGFREALALAGLETLSPGALGDLAEAGVLLPEETRGLLAARELLGTLAQTGGTDMDGLADAIDRIGDDVRRDTNLKVTAAALCTRVEGYGRYTPFAAGADGMYRFLAGRRQPVIVYVEVDRFARKAMDAGDGTARWEVMLSQELEIYAAGDGTLVMRRPAETDRSVSRAKIRDYYLINQTYLPGTLSVGRYNLKVTMRDEHRGAVAEAVVPFEIVADGRLVP